MSDVILKREKEIYRVLQCDGEKSLIIDCRKRSLPQWVTNDFLYGFKFIEEEELLGDLDVKLPDIKELSQNQLKEMHLRYGSISSCLLKVDDEVERRLLIKRSSNEYKVSEQTIRHRLCDYLVFKNIVALAPHLKKKKELSVDEKNFRWALNKYFYDSKKLSLKQAFKLLLRDKYVDLNGKILQNPPKFHQFKYFYYKNRKESNFIISRLGRGEYDRNFRPLLGDNIRDKFPSIGYGMLDSTVCDIYLINDSGDLVGRPILTACIDAYSGMCLGYSLSWKGGMECLRKLMVNVASNKIDWCKKFGIEINEEEWNCHWLPHKLITDKGSEYISDNFCQLIDLGVELIDLEPYRPELKSSVERFFGLIQSLFKKELINKGVVLKDFGDRGAIDYRRNACLTLEQFEKVILLCIIHYNCGRIIDLPLGIEGIKRHSKDLWNYCLDSQKDMLINVDLETLRKVLLPRTIGKFKREGLVVNKLRYRAIGFTNDYLKGGEVLVAFDPDDVSHIWLIREDKYIEFELIEKFFEKKRLCEVGKYLSNKVGINTINDELESEIKLSNDIENIVNHLEKRKIVVKGIRKNRKKEIDLGSL